MIILKVIAFLALALLQYVTVCESSALPISDIIDVNKEFACPDVCTMQYEPICVYLRDGSTLEFSNSCFLSIASCRRTFDILNTVKGRCGELQVM